MTNVQINAAIAEACGWRNEDGVWMRTANGIDHRRWKLWYWATDANAMNEAEEILNEEQRVVYEALLNEWLAKKRSGSRYTFNIPACHRAEAFLRALGKWEEVQK